MCLNMNVSVYYLNLNAGADGLCLGWTPGEGPDAMDVSVAGCWRCDDVDVSWSEYGK